MSLRPVDLARAGGISTQQVRNYEAAGILPPAARTPSGYRQYDELHRWALLAYRSLSRALGTAASAAILHAANAGDTVLACHLLDAAHADLHQERQNTEQLIVAMETLTQEPNLGAKRGVARIGELAGQLGVRPSALRVWEATGLLTASREPRTGTRCYSVVEVYHAGVINLMRKAGRGHDQIRPLIDELRLTGSTAALSVALHQRRQGHDRCSWLLLEGAVTLHRLLEVTGVLSAGQSHLNESAVRQRSDRRSGKY